MLGTLFVQFSSTFLQQRISFSLNDRFVSIKAFDRIYKLFPTSREERKRLGLFGTSLVGLFDQLLSVKNLT